MESYVIIVKDADGKIVAVLGKNNGNAFNTSERAEAVKEALTLEEGEAAKVVGIQPHNQEV